MNPSTQRQLNLSEFEACLVYRENSRTPRAILKNPVFKTGQNENNEKNAKNNEEKKRGGGKENIHRAMFQVSC